MCKLLAATLACLPKEQPGKCNSRKRVIEIFPLKNRRLVAALIYLPHTDGC
jgi:hypothetical protein